MKSFLSRLFHRPPYKLDTSVSKVVNGVTLHQLVATKSFEIVTVPHVIAWGESYVARGTRGGWVPSLDVLEPIPGSIPWLDENSHVSHPQARLIGGVSLKNTQWDSSGTAAIPHARLQIFENSQCSGHTNIEGCVTLHTSTVHNTHIHATNMDVQNTQLRNSRIFNGCKRKNAVLNSTWDHVNFLLQEEHALNINFTHWRHMTWHPSSLDVLPPTHIHHSDLQNVTSKHYCVSNAWLHGPTQPPQSTIYLPAPPYHFTTEPKGELFFVTLAHTDQTLSDTATPRCTHLVWYLLHSDDSSKALGVYDIDADSTIPIAELPAYVQQMRDKPLTESQQHALRTLKGWQWQHTLGVEPPQGQPWIFPQTPAVDMAMMETPVSFAP